MIMGENEILVDYHTAKDKFHQVKILAERNLVKPKEMAQWLKDHGEDVDGRYFASGKVAAKVKPIEPAPTKPTREELDAKMEQAAKQDAGKPRLTLVPMKIMFDIAEVREYGNRKYPDGGPDNWKRVEPERYKEALLRHVMAFCDGDNDGLDEESGLPHLWHAACNMAFLIALTWAETVREIKERRAE